MKIKRLSAVFFITGFVFLTTGCLDLLNALLTITPTLNSIEKCNEIASDSLMKNAAEDVYLIQVNTTGKILSKNLSNSGDVSYIYKTSRNLLENETQESNYFNNNYDEYHQKIQKLHSVPEEMLIKNDSRAAWSSNTNPKPNNRIVGEEKTFFYIQEQQKSDVVKKGKAVCKAIGKYCNVFFIQDTRLVSSSDIDFNKVAQTFDSIYTLETSIVGSNIYKTKAYSNIIDPMEKIDIIIADIYEVATSTQSGGVYGYFSSNDFFINDNYENSNETQCIFIDSYFLKKKTNTVYSTLVHEFNHLLNFCQKTCQYGLETMQTWYTEMLSMTTEDLFQNYLELKDEESPKSRLSTFNLTTYKGFETWDNENVYPNYANAYAFGAYLVRNFGGIELLKEIATNEYVDKDSITNALISCNKDFNYEKVLKYFPMVMVNRNLDGNKTEYSDYFTLNREFKYSDNLSFNAIKLDNFYQKDEKGKKYGPQEGFVEVGYVYDSIYPSGFIVYDITPTNIFNPSDYGIYYKNNSGITYLVNYSKIETEE